MINSDMLYDVLLGEEVLDIIADLTIFSEKHDLLSDKENQEEEDEEDVTDEFFDDDDDNDNEEEEEDDNNNDTN